MYFLACFILYTGFKYIFFKTWSCKFNKLEKTALVVKTSNKITHAYFLLTKFDFFLIRASVVI